jgi:hypothetical protein
MRRLAEKNSTKAASKATIQGQEFDLQQLPPEQAAVASYREAGEYQQLVSEVLQHATTTFEKLPDDSPHADYFREAKDELQEHYGNVCRYVSERGVEMIDALDMTQPESLIEVPKLVVE